MTLTWDNGQGLVFRRTISVDEKSMFTVKNAVENTAKEIATRFDFKSTSASVELKDKEITMIGDEPYGNYNRIMLSHVLAGESSIDDDDLMLNPMAWYRENDVKLYAGDRAVALDRFAKTVICESGRSLGR